MNVRSLGYLGVQSNKLDAWRQYCTDFLGLMDVSSSDAEQRYRMDNQAWRLSVCKGEQEDLSYVGFEVSNGESLAELRARLESLGYHAQRDDELAADRGVIELWRLTDPDGLQIELYHGATDVSECRFVSPTGVKGFVTAEEGFGHIVLYTKDIELKKRFYLDGLGFRLSDTMTLGPAEVIFLHCNTRHHTLALAEAPVERHLNHLMLQVAEFNDVGYALDKAMEMDIPITASLGCHTNDRMLSFYAQTPSGFDVEFGFGGATIGPNWSVAHYNSASLWGHKRDALMGSTTPD